MAPRPARTREMQEASHGQHYQDGLPPSTLQAQIVDNLTKTRRQSSSTDNQVHLRQLLQEILDADRKGDREIGIVEKSLEVNYRLIYVIVRAGLEVLSAGNPFESPNDVHTQALNTLAVIDLTISRTPEVLFCPPPSQDFNGLPSGPLFLWLVPQLINLLGFDIEDDLCEGVQKVLRTSLAAQTRLTSLKMRIAPVRMYVQGCIKDLFFCLKACEEDNSKNGSSDPFQVPSAETIMEVYTPASGRDAGPNIASQVAHKNSSQNISTIVHLLFVLVPGPSSVATKSTNTSHYFDCEWILDCLSRVNSLFDSVKGTGVVKAAKRSCYSYMLMTLSICLISSSKLKCEATSLLQATALLCHGISSCLALASEKASLAMDNAICSSLVDLLAIGMKSTVVSQVCCDCLDPMLQAHVLQPGKVDNFSVDVQRALTLALHVRKRSRFAVLTAASLKQLLSFQAHDLGERFERLLRSGDSQLESNEDDRPRKRARLSIMETSRATDAAVRQITEIVYTHLGLDLDTGVKDLAQHDLNEDVREMPEDEQCSLFVHLGQLGCAVAQTMAWPERVCSTCDSEAPKDSEKTYIDDDYSGGLLSTMTKLLQLPQVQKSSRSRVAAMTAVRRLLLHTANPSQFDLSTSQLGNWCLQGLRSSLRDLRIAAGKTLTVFLRDQVDVKFLRQNRITTLDLLRTLSKKGDINLLETCILAWSQIASTCGEDEMNIVLLRLVEYLGHTNTLISGLANDELLRLSLHSSFVARRLFEPYWRTVAVAVVKDLQSRPQIAQRLCELLNIEIPEFLRLTQLYTTPFLVLTKKRHILQRVADACVTNHSIWTLCMDQEHLTAIIALLLLQPSTDPEGTVISLLCEASPEFAGYQLLDIAKHYFHRIATELLKVAGEDDVNTRARAHQAIQFLAELSPRKGTASKSSSRKNNAIGAFFDFHVLAIMALLSDVVSEIKKASYPIAERRRCLGAINEMIKLGKSHVCSALPQICACLRSAVQEEELSDYALEAWMVLLTSLGEEDIESLVDPTFALIAQHWTSFNPVTQQRAYEMISLLLKTHAGMIREMVNTIPSLASIPLMSKFEGELGKLKGQMDQKRRLQAFVQRCQNENDVVVLRALIELEAYLMEQQDFVHGLAISEQPDAIVAQLTRSLLDACVRFSETSSSIAVLCAKCLGLIGCLDTTRIEAQRETKDILVLSNFGKEDETVDFVVFFIQEVLVKAFLSATNTRAQGFLGYAIQELLKFCDFDNSVTGRGRDLQTSGQYRRWIAMPETIRNTLAPFLTSHYILSSTVSIPECQYPLFNANTSHASWLRNFVFDLLRKGCGANAEITFPICRRVVRGQDIAISNFLLPFVALNIVVGGLPEQGEEIANEFSTVLSTKLPDNNPALRETIILCSQNIFQTLDYFSRWMQEKRKEIARAKSIADRTGRASFEADSKLDSKQVASVDSVLSSIPAEIMARRAVECKSFARALFYWEQHIRQEKERMNLRAKTTGEEMNEAAEHIELENLYERLQDIYTQIDEPDGIEGISAHLQVLNIDQQVLEHRKAGRWTAVQSWYELLLTERPNDMDVQLNLLTSLKESGQHDVLLNQIAGLQLSEGGTMLSKPFAVEASWVTGKWDKLASYVKGSDSNGGGDFNVGVGLVMNALHEKDFDRSREIMDKIRSDTARTMTMTTTTTIQACHDTLLKFHVLAEIEAISGIRDHNRVDLSSLTTTLNRRLEVLGSFLSDKQYLLGVRRAAMQLSRFEFSDLDISSAWLTSARLARKGDFTHQAFNAVLHASQLGDNSATIEHSRLLWREGHHRKAIQSLEGAIAANAFRTLDSNNNTGPTATSNPEGQQQQIVTARAHLLLAKWIDRAGQTQSDVIVSRYKKAVEFHNRWEKGHYYLGKHYNKLLESEKAKAPSKQAQTFITGETAKLVIENYLRSIAFGAKYIYQTLPRILTLWLELGTDVDKHLDPKYGNDSNFRAHVENQRNKVFAAVNTQIKKYVDRLPAFAFYTAFAQIVARICHTNDKIYASLVDIIAKVVMTHPQQALWTLLAMVKSSAKDRSHRGAACMTRILENAKKLKTETAGSEVKALMAHGQKLSEQLLHICEGEIPGKPTNVSLSKVLGFNHKIAPCRLVIPLESTMTASLPTITDNINMKAHKAFSKDTITISVFTDDVLVLNSLQRPRKISIRGSDGRVYGLLCKPKDDLRKDQRLMEFNAMINRSLKKDAESSKRRLYIKTYAVTPLNEECGLIEWVDNLKTLRDILLKLYKQKNIPVNYAEIKVLLDAACAPHATDPDLFTTRVLPLFPPVFHEWFVTMFPSPPAWFGARLRYTRSCAVMSVVGHVLGLGDRHGENVLLEESDGGTFHVDFNCLFDKGLTFEKPELVPFRLTHNMVDAFGAYGVDGPFRRSCELVAAIVRGGEDTLMTILETFVFDPTTDFAGKRKRRAGGDVPDTPEGVLDRVRSKVRGLLPGESVPLSVEGYVQELIGQATDPRRLASMYIGWCAFF